MIWKSLEGVVSAFWYIICVFVLGAFAYFFGFDLIAEVSIESVFGMLLLLPFLFVFSLRRREARIDKDGNPYGRLGLGARLFWFSVGALYLHRAIPPLLGLEIWGHSDQGNKGPDMQLVGVLIFFALWTIAYAWKARVRWNETGMTKTSAFLFTHKRQWDNLREVDEREAVLKFSKEGQIRLSSFFEGHKDLIAYAKDRLENS